MDLEIDPVIIPLCHDENETDDFECSSCDGTVGDGILDDDTDSEAPDDGGGDNAEGLEEELDPLELERVWAADRAAVEAFHRNTPYYPCAPSCQGRRLVFDDIDEPMDTS